MEYREIQSYLSDNDLNGWLLADFHARNEIAMTALGLEGHLTRRSFYYIPNSGEPVAFVHKVERDKFGNLPGKIIAYSGYTELEAELKSTLSNQGKIAMEYSPNGRLPYIGLVDAGTIELVRGLGVEVVSSADLVAYFQARLSAEQIELHREAAVNVVKIKDAAFEFIAKRINSGRPATEYAVQQYILDQFEQAGMETDFAPIVGVDGNAGNPHYEPTAEASATVDRGHLALIDLWAKMKRPGAAFADITWMGYTGSADEIPQRYHDIFSVLTRARDAAVAHVTDNVGAGPVYGADIDDACRKVITEAGYGEYFVHRTGHSIGINVHGAGPNIDNLETEDRRQLQPGHLFSIEPGIYMKDCGFRTEIDVLMTDNGCEVTTQPLQTEIMPLF